MYLSQFGYMSPGLHNPSSGHLMSVDVLNKAIQEFQSFAGLNITGTLQIYEWKTNVNIKSFIRFDFNDARFPSQIFMIGCSDLNKFKRVGISLNGS